MANPIDFRTLFNIGGNAAPGAPMAGGGSIPAPEVDVNVQVPGIRGAVLAGQQSPVRLPIRRGGPQISEIELGQMTGLKPSELSRRQRARTRLGQEATQRQAREQAGQRQAAQQLQAQQARRQELEFGLAGKVLPVQIRADAAAAEAAAGREFTGGEAQKDRALTASESAAKRQLQESLQKSTQEFEAAQGKLSFSQKQALQAQKLQGELNKARAEGNADMVSAIADAAMNALSARKLEEDRRAGLTEKERGKLGELAPATTFGEFSEQAGVAPGEALARDINGDGNESAAETEYNKIVTLIRQRSDRLTPVQEKRLKDRQKELEAEIFAGPA